eukprot:2348067-Rhodomonas_salina.1
MHRNCWLIPSGGQWPPPFWASPVGRKHWLVVDDRLACPNGLTVHETSESDRNILVWCTALLATDT